MTIWTVSVLITSTFDNFYFFCFFRGITTSSSYVCNLVSYTLLSEVLPMKNRGKWLGSFEFVVILGQLQLLLVMFATFEKLGEGNIQLVIFYLFLLLLATCIICHLYCDESPRFLCFHNKTTECCLLIDKIYQENNNIKEYVYMSTENKEKIVLWVNSLQKEEYNNNDKKDVSISSLFKGPYKMITITLYFVWFANAMVSAGNDFIYPLTVYKIYENQSENLLMIMLELNIIMLPFLIPAVIATDMELLGRKKTLSISLSLLGVSCFFVWLNLFFNIFFWLFLAKYAISINYMILSIYTNEIYPTSLRILGFGTSSGLGKIASIFAPFFSVYLSNSNIYLPFGFYSIVSLIGGILLVNLKFDTTNENMDRILLEDVEMVCPKPKVKNNNHI